MKNTMAVIKKQAKDTLKNQTILIQFVMFPILTVIMTRVITLNDMPENFFVFLFASMYIGMAPLTAAASVISEEKEKNTLRVLLMSNVKPYEYLLGIGIYIWVMCMLGSLVICTAGSFDFKTGLSFMLAMSLGILLSILAGAAIGTWSKTQMMATSITVPVMLILSFLPMLSRFNSGIAKAARFIYTEQISSLLESAGHIKLEAGSIVILAANMLIVAILFITAYSRSRLD